MVRDVYNLIRGILRVRGSRLPMRLKIGVAWTYLRLRVKNRIYIWIRRSPREESILGRRFRFFNYSTFVYLFEEIFIEQSYNFNATRPDPVILDAGANIGMSVFYLRLLHPGAQIVAYEPDPATFSLLKWNIQSNGLSGVEIRNQALLDRDGEVEFHTDAEKPGSLGMSTVAGRRDHQVPVSFKVPCVRFSSQLRDKIDFLKMDIEGAEADCLGEAARNGRLRHVEQMIVECHHNTGNAGTLRNVLNTLENSGFSFQVSALSRTPYVKNQPQDVHVYAYHA